jgi:signal transduction histidine kinase
MSKDDAVNILMVDDQPAKLLSYEVILSELGENLIKAGSGREALEHLLKTDIAIVLMDVSMPEIDGFELAELIRQHPRYQQTAIIFISAVHLTDLDRLKGYQHGAVDYIAVPVIPDLLRAKVSVFAELYRKTQQLERANKELEAFSYSVSHDLRAPLRAIDGFSKVLLTEYGEKFDAQGRHYLQRVQAGTQLMSALIDALLQLSRVTRAQLRQEPINLTELARGVVAELRSTEPSREVDVEIAAGLSTRGDMRLVTIALENLLWNAWKFTVKQPEAHIAFGQESKGNETVFYVRDNGAGFDMAYAYKLFTPFQRLHSSSEFEGTGIGLATVHRIISRHGGRIWAEAAVDKGASFFFTLGDRQ